MSKVTIKLDRKDVRDNILNADFTIQECKRVATELAEQVYSKNGFHIKTFAGTQRGHAIAFPNTREHDS